MADPSPRDKARLPLFVTWCAKDVLDSTQTLDGWEELAYRRLIDLAVVTGDALPDDDKRLAWMTKTGRRWPGIKASLIAAGKIIVTDGKIRVAEAAAMLQKSARKMERKAVACRAQNGMSNPLKNNHVPAETDSISGVKPGNVRAATIEPLTKKEKREKEKPFRPAAGNVFPLAVTAADTDRETWEIVLSRFDPAKDWTWPVFRGPRPDEPGCFAPPDLLAKCGFPLIASHPPRRTGHG